MILLIDGFNLIYKFPELEVLMYESKLNLAREGLLKTLNQYKIKRKNIVIHVFFDGKKDVGSEVRRDEYGGIKIYFSHDTSADLLIKEYIKRDPSPSSLYVVTSDKDILFYCKRFACKAQKSEDFAKWVNRFLFAPIDTEEKPADVKVSGSELEFWQDFFKKKIK